MQYPWSRFAETILSAVAVPVLIFFGLLCTVGLGHLDSIRFQDFHVGTWVVYGRFKGMGEQIFRHFF